MGTGDAMNTMVPMCFMMATQTAYDFFVNLKKELEEKIAKGEGEIPEEKYRLMWGGGLPAWYALSDFNYFNSKGASFPVETTYRMVAPLHEMDIPETNDPIEHLAWRWLGYWTFWYDKAKKRQGSEPDVERLINWIEEYKIDGIVMHEAFSCRTWHVGLIWELHQLAKIYKPIPVFVIGRDGKEREGLQRNSFPHSGKRHHRYHFLFRGGHKKQDRCLHRDSGIESNQQGSLMFRKVKIRAQVRR